MELNVRDIRQTGGCYVVAYRAEFEITAEPVVKVTIGSIHPMSEASCASSAAEAIRMGFEEVLLPSNRGASVTIYDLVLHPVDFRQHQFTRVTAKFLRELLDQENREIEQLIQNYIEEKNDDPRLTAPSFREAIYRFLHSRVSLEHAPLLRRLLDFEMDWRRAYWSGAKSLADDGSDDYTDSLYWCGLLLHRAGRLEDVLPMWAAKRMDFDTGCGFDVQFLVGAGVDATLDYLRDIDSPEAQDAWKSLLHYKQAGFFDNLDVWLEDWIAYYLDED